MNKPSSVKVTAKEVIASPRDAAYGKYSFDNIDPSGEPPYIDETRDGQYVLIQEDKDGNIIFESLPYGSMRALNKAITDYHADFDEYDVYG